MSQIRTSTYKVRGGLCIWGLGSRIGRDVCFGYTCCRWRCELNEWTGNEGLRGFYYLSGIFQWYQEGGRKIGKYVTNKYL